MMALASADDDSLAKRAVAGIVALLVWVTARKPEVAGVPLVTVAEIENDRPLAVTALSTSGQLPTLVKSGIGQRGEAAAAAR